MECLPGKTRLLCRTLLIGDRLDIRPLTMLQRIATTPLTVTADGDGVAVLFRYGGVVLFNVTAADEAILLERLRPFVSGPFAKTEVEEIEVRVDPDAAEGIDGGTIVIRNREVERFQVVAEDMGKSAVLGLYESRVADAFDRIEPFALEIETTGRSRRKARELLRHLGAALLSQQQMVSRVQAAEKPDLLWDRPDLEMLHLRLADEFELRERHVVLERKLDLIARTAQILLELLQSRRSLRVEWYIVLLIVFEIFLSLVGMTLWRR